MDVADEVLVTCIGEALTKPLLQLRNRAKKVSTLAAFLKYSSLRSKGMPIITKARDKFRQRLAAVERENVKKYGFIENRESTYGDT